MKQLKQSSKMHSNCTNITLTRRTVIGSLIFMTSTVIFIHYYFKISNNTNIIANLDIEINSATTTKLAAAVINHPKWLVVNTISLPTEDLKKLAAIKDWKVVVVGDTKTPSNWSFPDVYYLNVDQQQQLGFKIVNRLPYNSYTRKMIGYLFAIRNGAQFIYDTDDDTHPTGGKIDFHQQPTMSGLIYDDVSKPVVNPLAHFSQHHLWPGGFPLEFIAIKANRSYRLCTFKTPAIQQSLVNGEPDVDAIYRLINKGSATNKSINITFDEHAPPMTLPSGVFAPFNSQNTFFAYEAFWSLFLPTTVAFRVTDIWRGYWTQRLLWLIGQNLAIFPPSAVQFRNPHNYLKDFDDEIQVFEEAGKLIQYLSRWQCSSNTSFFSCVRQLTSDMVQSDFLKEEDSELVQLWLDDLISVGYKEPMLKTIPLHNMCSQPEDSIRINFSPIISQHNHGFRDIFSFCDNDFQNRSVMKKDFTSHLDPVVPKKPSYNFNNILLVIVFKYPNISHARMLEVLYRDHFPNILICSQAKSISDFQKEISSTWLTWRTNDISFVNITSNASLFGYECAIRAIEMNYKVDGYMFLDDDILFKFWKIVPFDVGLSRIQNDTFAPLSYQNRSDDKCCSGQWNSLWPRCKNDTNSALDEIEQISKSSSDSRAELFQQFVNNRYANKFNMTLVSYSKSDLYYISQKDSKMFSQVIRIFLKHKVYSDIAVPTTLSGCTAEELQTNDGFLGSSILGGDRNLPLNFFTNSSVYVHPLNIKQLLPGTELLKSYCTDYITEYLHHW